jgi:hypothetical protein
MINDNFLLYYNKSAELDKERLAVAQFAKN